MQALLFSVNTAQWAALKIAGRFNKKLFYRGKLATLRLKDIPEPKLPSPNWVKIQTGYCGICASDLNLVFLKDSPSASPFTSFPCVLGHEICGKVVETGNKVQRVSEGDAVTIAPHLNCSAREIQPPCPACAAGRVGHCANYASGELAPGMFTGICRDTGGGFAPYFVAHESQVFRTREMSMDSAVMIEPLAVALQAVFDNRPQKGEHVLVIGGGVIGNLIVRAIRGLDIGCAITVLTRSSTTAAELAQKSGADHLLHGRNLFVKSAEITGATVHKPLKGKKILMGGFNRVFDVVGNTRTLNLAMRCMSSCGVLSVVGIGHDVKLDLTPLWLKGQTMRGVFCYGFVHTDVGNQHVFDVAIEKINQKKITVDDMVTHRFSLEDYEKMITVNLNKRKYGAIKTIFTF